MEQVCVWSGTAMRVIVAGLIALTPGMLVWMGLLGIWLAFRRVGLGNAFQRLGQEDGTAGGPTPIKN